MRLGRGHHTFGIRRWVEPVQRHLTEAGIYSPWQDAACDRERWNSMELACVARVTRKSITAICERAAPGRFLAIFEDLR